MRSLIFVAGALGATALVGSLGAYKSSNGSEGRRSPPATADGDGGASLATTTFKVGGTVTGLSGGGLVLQNNVGDSLPISASGAFEFARPLATGAAFNVTVKDQPTAPPQTCTVSSGTGTVGSADIKDVVVACTTNSYVVGGTVSGLVNNGLVLENNGGDALTINAAKSGPFSFAIAIKSGATYDVQVKTQPTGEAEQECSVTAGAGTVADGPVTSVVVTCITSKRVFITSARYDANLGGLDGADAKCQALADAAGLGGTYKAWLSDDTGSPNTRFTKSSTPYVRVDGTIVANDWDDLTDGTLASSISITELKTPGPSGNTCGDSAVWSNTTTSGTLLTSDDDCSNWSGTAGGGVNLGVGTSTNEGFTSGCSLNGTQVCPSTLGIFAASLYCFEQ